MNVITKKPMGKRIGIFAILFAMILTMAAPMASFADVLPTQTTGTITIHKYLLDEKDAGPIGTGQASDDSGVPNDATPLSEIPFTVTQVVPANDVDADGDVLWTENGVDYKAKKDVAVLSGETNGSGIYETGTLPLGLYFIKEGESAKVASPVKPFIVQIPTTLQGTNGADDSLIYDVNVFPKNSALSIDKEAVAAGGDQADAKDHLPVNIGDDVDWYITADIPTDITKTDVKYAIWDKYPVGMTYKAGSVVVTGADANGNVSFVLNTDYTIDTSATNIVKVIFTDAGRTKLASLTDRVTVKLTTTITADLAPDIATTGTNNADIKYTNEYGEDKDIPADPSDVYTGGYSFQKVDAGDPSVKLDGARFKLVRRASDSSTFENDLAAAKAASATDPSATTDGYFKYPSIAGHDPADALVATSAATTGYTAFTGIKYGLPGETAQTGTPALFWLVEVDAPNGYRLPGEAKPIEIKYNSYNTSTTTQVTNAKGFEFPLTGGMGTLIFVVGGIVLIGLAGIVIVSTSRRGKKQESVK
jgi:fimbrial isopeptide formation D2 family protein